MSQKLRVTQEQLEDLRSVVSSATPLPNGDWMVDVCDTTIDRVIMFCVNGLDASQAIVRAMVHERSGARGADALGLVVG